MLSVAIAAKYPHNALLVECQEVITVLAIGQSVVQGPEIFWPGKLEGIQVRDMHSFGYWLFQNSSTQRFAIKR